jgi:hypothetical protein
MLFIGQQRKKRRSAFRMLDSTMWKCKGKGRT